MTKKERIANLELQIAGLRAEISALKQMIEKKQDKQISYGPFNPDPMIPLLNPTWPTLTPWAPPYEPYAHPPIVTCEVKQ